MTIYTASKRSPYETGHLSYYPENNIIDKLKRSYIVGSRGASQLGGIF